MLHGIVPLAFALVDSIESTINVEHARVILISVGLWYFSIVILIKICKKESDCRQKSLVLLIFTMTHIVKTKKNLPCSILKAFSLLTL
jgi:hypothetical protein